MIYLLLWTALLLLLASPAVALRDSSYLDISDRVQLHRACWDIAPCAQVARMDPALDRLPLRGAPVWLKDHLLRAQEELIALRNETGGGAYPVVHALAMIRAAYALRSRYPRGLSCPDSDARLAYSDGYLDLTCLCHAGRVCGAAHASFRETAQARVQNPVALPLLRQTSPELPTSAVLFFSASVALCAAAFILAVVAVFRQRRVQLD